METIGNLENMRTRIIPTYSKLPMLLDILQSTSGAVAMSRGAFWVPPSRSPASAGRSSTATDRERPGGWVAGDPQDPDPWS